MLTGCQGSDSGQEDAVDFLGSVSENFVVDAYLGLDTDTIGKRAIASWKKKTWKNFSNEVARTGGAARKTLVNFGNEALMAPAFNAADYSKQLEVLRGISGVHELTSIYKTKKSDVTAAKILEGAKAVNLALNSTEEVLQSKSLADLDKLLHAQVLFLEVVGVLDEYQQGPKLAGWGSAIKAFTRMGAKAAGATAKTGSAAAKNAASGVTSHPLPPSIGERLQQAAATAGHTVSNETKDFVGKVYENVKDTAANSAAGAITGGVVGGIAGKSAGSNDSGGSSGNNDDSKDDKGGDDW